MYNFLSLGRFSNIRQIPNLYKTLLNKRILSGEELCSFMPIPQA
jgi:hypothetical protein